MIIGAIVALLPSLLGGLFVSVVIEGRHPRPADEDAVRRDLSRLFADVVALLDVVVIAAVASGGESLNSVASLLAFLVPGNAAVGALLCPAGQSISREWAS